MKLQNSKCDKTQQLKLWSNSNCDETQKLILWWNWKHLNCDKIQIVTKFKTQIVMKLKNSNGDKTQKLKLWQDSKTQMSKKNLKKNHIVTKLKNSKWQNLSCDKTQIVTKLKFGQKSSCDKTQIVTKIKLWRKT